MIEADGGFEIVAVAGTAEDAIEALGQVRVDIVLLDLEMPGVGRAEVDPRHPRGRARARKVLIVSSLAEEGAEETVAALALGAADTLAQARHRPLQRPLFRSAARQAARARPRRPRRPRRAPQRDVRTRRGARSAMADEPLELLAIGASTGGIHALASLFEALPRQIGVPILVTQHLPAPFMAVFARQLPRASGREALVAEDGMRAAARPDRDRAGRCPSAASTQSAASWSSGCSTPEVGQRAACHRSIRCSPRPARCSAPARLAWCLPAWAATAPRARARLVAAGGAVHRPGRGQLGRLGHAARGRRSRPRLRDPAPRKIARRIARRVEEASCK